MSLDTCQGMTLVQVTYNQSIIFQNNNVYFHFYRFLLFCTRLTFDLVLWPRVIYRLGIHPYEFGHMPRNSMSICRIMYSKMPTKPKLSHFFGFGLPSIRGKVCIRPKFTTRPSSQGRHRLLKSGPAMKHQIRFTSAVCRSWGRAREGAFLLS